MNYFSLFCISSSSEPDTTLFGASCQENGTPQPFQFACSAHGRPHATRSPLRPSGPFVLWECLSRHVARLKGTEEDTETLTTAEIAERAGVAQRTVQRWLKRGELHVTALRGGYVTHGI